MNAVSVRYFDGKMSTPHLAQVSPLTHQSTTTDFIVRWQNQAGEVVRRHYLIAQCEYLPAVDGSPHVLMLVDGAKIEFDQEMPAWLVVKHRRMFHHILHLERQWRWIGVSVVILCLFVFGVVRVGIPYASHHIVKNLPEEILSNAGHQAEQYIIKLTQPSTLTPDRQQEIIDLYHQIDTPPKAKILIRKGGELGVNAVAIPNNTIIITDELINLAQHDHEILAVLAHEQGHLVHRHSLEQAIANLGLGVLIVVITGDVSDILLGFPMLLVNSHYSQKAELEADRYAIDTLKRIGSSPMYLANFFKHIQQEHGDEGHWSILSTHPDTQKRIEQVEHEHQ